ncbi:MAG: glucose-1-phosphate [Geobacteraceae bacterium]|nr:MAG: glucose-1-phosphate [Geobacteraceae bacterium]
MKVVILAGGLGTRLSEETVVRPKPMVEIGGRPILWHIMKTYSFYGFNDFIICLGFKGYVIKEYFSNYFLHMSDVTFDLRNNSMVVHQQYAEPWKVTLVDTGADSMTGGRVKRVAQYIGGEPFMLTYGDGVADINIRELVSYHNSHGCQATVTSTQPSGRFGILNINTAGKVVAFQEKPAGDGAWINGGFFVLEAGVLDRIDGDSTVFEKEPLEGLARDGQLAAYKHNGFWQPMDTLRDKIHLEELWNSGRAPWKIW